MARLELPQIDEIKEIHQFDGRLRYYINQGSEGLLQVLTPDLSLEATGTVFDVHVGVEGTLVEAVEGNLNVLTLDRTSDVPLQSGQAVWASAINSGQLTLRQGSGLKVAKDGERRRDSGDGSSEENETSDTSAGSESGSSAGSNDGSDASGDDDTSDGGSGKGGKGGRGKK